MALSAKRQATEPLNPRTPDRKRARLDFLSLCGESDEKENMPFWRLPKPASSIYKKELLVGATAEEEACLAFLNQARSTQQPGPQVQAQRNEQARLASLHQARSALQPRQQGLLSPDTLPPLRQFTVPSRLLHAPQRQPEVHPIIGREKECAELDQFLQQSLDQGPSNGRSLYISGGPGTGKTCSVRARIDKWKMRVPDTLVLEVNCMDLAQRSVSGVLQRLLEKMGCPRTVGRSLQGLAADVAANLRRKAARVVIVVDEVDQLVKRSNGQAAAGALSLETLLSLPQLAESPAVALVAIANAVDLLERTSVLSATLNCSMILFEAYGKDQLKNIVTSRLKAVEGGEAALKALGPVKVELRLRQVAKECGDCRQVLSLIEEALFEAKCAQQALAAESPSEGELSAKRDVRPLTRTGRNDPLKAIAQLPLEQKILLSALATSKQEATKMNDVCKRYKELCKVLRQPDNLGTKIQVSSALAALEQRGLLEIRGSRRPTKIIRTQHLVIEATVELSVSCEALSESVVRALRSEGFGESVVTALGLIG